MNKIKLLSVASLSIIGSSLLTLPTAYTHDLGSGVNCMAANLTQALAGIGWSQFGVVNNATSSFFVVCPMDRGLTEPLPTGVGVIGIFPGSGTIECTTRTQALGTGAFTSVSYTVSSNENGLGINRGLHLELFAIASDQANTTAVCALDPGEGIELAYTF